MSELLSAQSVRFAYDGVPALEDVAISLAVGQIVAVLGPNGSGKSTLLKVLLGHLHADGQIVWNGKSLGSWRRRDLARVVAYLPQSPTWDATQTVSDTLRLGRAPYWGALSLESAEDEAAVRRVAQLLELNDLLDRNMDQLSGGQRQRVLIGRCLTQEPRAILLDEPDTFLDLKHQIDLCRLLRRLARESGLGVLMASHDLNLAASFADRMVLLREGRIAAAGDTQQVLQPEILTEVYGVQMERIDRAGGPVLVPRMAD
jgi:ABC-type cobalamin/Fe3+-siderophores transport system ATPase subunit